MKQQACTSHAKSEDLECQFNFDRLTVCARNIIIRDRSAALLAGDIRVLWSDLFPELVVSTPKKEPSDNHHAIQKLLGYHRFSDAQHLIDQSDAPVPLDDKVILGLKAKINPPCVVDARPCKDVPHPTPDAGPNLQLFDFEDDDESRRHFLQTFADSTNQIKPGRRILQFT